MKLNCKFQSDNGAIIAVDSVIEKTCGLILIGKIQTGSLSEGATVDIQIGDKAPLYDKVLRIELNHEEVAEATEGMMVGICLPQTTKEGLLQYLEK